MRKYHSNRIFGKLEKLWNYITENDLAFEDRIWGKRLKELEFTMSEFEARVGRHTDNWEKIYGVCSPGLMGKFNNWWKDALRDSVIHL